MSTAATRMALIFVFGLLVTTLWAAERNGGLNFAPGADQPIKISAVQGGVRRIPRGWESSYRGNVKVLQGDLTLTCDRLVVVYEERGKNEKGSHVEGRQGNLGRTTDIKSITAEGHVKIVQDDRTALAGKAVYDNAQRTITLTEKPRLRQCGDMLEAEKIIFYLDENRSEFLGGKSGITGILTPGKCRKERER